MRRAVAVLIAAGLAACGGSNVAQGVAGTGIGHASDVTMPGTILGLNVTAENVTATVKDSLHSSVDSVALYGLRDGTLLEATFQVSHFARGVRYTTTAFRQTIVDEIGEQQPTELDISSQDVYATTGNRQKVWIWFTGPDLFILSVRSGYETPRDLLRQLLEVTS